MPASTSARFTHSRNARLGQIEVLGDLPDAPVADPAEAHRLCLELRVNDLRFRPMVEHSYRTGVRFLVSTETGEDQIARDPLDTLL